MGLRNKISSKDDLKTIEKKLIANLGAKSNFRNRGLTNEQFGFKATLLQITQEILKNTKNGGDDE